jgi:putative photosynthetic complex assembly protein
MSASHDPLIPRGAVIGAGLLIAATVALVGTAQISKVISPPAHKAEPAVEDIAETRTVRFTEKNGEAVAAFDVTSGEKIVDLAQTDGFVRVVLSSLAFDRNRMGKREEPTFTLTRWADGRISIEDMTTGIAINLGAFGEANKSVFRKFLKSEATTS